MNYVKPKRGKIATQYRIILGVEFRSAPTGNGDAVITRLLR